MLYKGTKEKINTLIFIERINKYSNDHSHNKDLCSNSIWGIKAKKNKRLKDETIL